MRRRRTVDNELLGFIVEKGNSKAFVEVGDFGDALGFTFKKANYTIRVIEAAFPDAVNLGSVCGATCFSDVLVTALKVENANSAIDWNTKFTF